MAMGWDRMAIVISFEKWIGSPAIAHRPLPVIDDYPMCKNIAASVAHGELLKGLEGGRFSV